MGKWMVSIAAIYCGLAVGLGAYHAHGLKKFLSSRYPDPLEVQKKSDQWSTAVDYQMTQGLALLALGLFHSAAGFRHQEKSSENSSVDLRHAKTSKQIRFSFILLLVGVTVFSGCLYGLALGGPKILGAITPVGGLGMLAGWATVALFGSQWASKVRTE